MMRRQFAFVLVFVCAVAVSISLQQPLAGAQAQVGELVIRFEDPDPANRNRAFYELLRLGSGRDMHGLTYQIPSVLANLYKLSPESADQVKVGLIRLLERENQFVQAQRREYERTGKTLSEAYVDYYGDLIASVAALKDQRAVNALLDVIATGNMATRALAGFGRLALDQVLKRLDDPDQTIREAAVRVLVQMLGNYILDSR